MSLSNNLLYRNWLELAYVGSLVVVNIFGTRCLSVIPLLFRNWLELAYVGSLVVVNIFGTRCLWLALLVLLIGLTAREFFQMAVSLRYC